MGPDGVKLVIIDGGDGISDPLCRLVLNVDALEPSRLFLQVSADYRARQGNLDGLFS